MIGRRDPMRDELTALDELDREVHRPARRPSSLIVPILITMIVMTGSVTIAWYSYHAGVKEGSEGAAPLLKPAGPMKVAPENPGGKKIPHQELTVYQSLNDKSAGPVERILPPPERPMTPPTPAAADQGESSRVRSADMAPVEAPNAPAASGQPGPSIPAARSLLPPPTASAPQKEVQTALNQPKEQPQAAKVPPAEVKPVEVKPADKKAQAEPVSKRPEPQVAAIPKGAYRVQLGSVSTEGQATGFWSVQHEKNGDLLGKLVLNVEKATISGRTYYRIQAGPLKDAASARALCDQLKRRQIGCIIVSPKS